MCFKQKANAISESLPLTNGLDFLKEKKIIWMIQIVFSTTGNIFAKNSNILHTSGTKMLRVQL